MNDERWMKNDSDKMETGGTYGKEPRTPELNTPRPLILNDSITTRPWFIKHTHHGGDQTLKRNKSGILVLMPTGGSVTTLFLLLLLLLLWTLEHLILSYRSLDLLITSILSWRSYLDDLISTIYDLILISWSYHQMMIQDTFLYTVAYKTVPMFGMLRLIGL